MADDKESSKKQKNKNPLVGAQTQPTTLNNSEKLGIDTNKEFVDNLIEAGLANCLDTTELDNFTAISNSRDQIYQLIDTMMRDSSVAAIVRTYTEDVCEMADNGHIVWCESEDPNITKFINYLLNIMNVDKNIFNWVYSLIEYGDVYLRLYRESDYEDPLFKKTNIDNAFSAHTQLNESANLNETVFLNTHDLSDPYSYYVEMVPDPGTMFELTKLGKTYGYIETPNEKMNLSYLDSFSGINTGTAGTYNYKLKSNDVIVYQADDFVHACLEDNYTRYPEKVDIFLTDDAYNTNSNAQSYSVRRGKSLLYDSYKIWREKTLLEDAILLNRVTRSSVVRMIQVEVGDMPKSQTKNTLSRVKALMEQKSALNTGSSMSEYNNPGAFENNVYLATHNGQGAVSVQAVGGDVDVKDIADLDYWTNKFFSSYGIPKQFFGWTDDGAGFNGGTSLTILSSVYAKGVKRVQNAILQMITDAINLILVNKGCKAYLNNFVLKMKSPSTQEEKDYREELGNKITTISNIQSLFADIEDKARKLKILKTLITTLNYGCDLGAIIEEEISATEAAAQAEAEAGEETAENANNTPENSANDSADFESSDAETADIELGSSAEVPMESLFNKNDNTVLIEELPINLDTDDVLPLPEDLGKDFSKNE